MGYPQWFPAKGQSLEELVAARQGLVQKAIKGRPMKIRVTIEYDIPRWDEAALELQGLREREEQRWITSETLLALPGSATVKVELGDPPSVVQASPR